MKRLVRVNLHHQRRLAQDSEVFKPNQTKVFI
jgi:hypothetical protein